MRSLVILISTWWGTGFSPIASGTVGTLAAIPLYLIMAGMPLLPYIFLLAAITILSCWIADRAEKVFEEKDSGKIVIDEVVGFLVTMTGVSSSFTAVVLGFLLFRFFDIVKVPPANFFDSRLKNGCGVVLDDVAAGVYACLSLHLLLRII